MDQGDEEGSEGSNAVSQARLKTYIKPRIPSTQEVLDRRSRKNAQSRARAAKLRQRIVDIEHKPAEERTEEEQQLLHRYLSGEITPAEFAQLGAEFRVAQIQLE